MKLIKLLLACLVGLALTGLAVPAGAVQVTLDNTGDTWIWNSGIPPWEKYNWGASDRIEMDPTQGPQGLVRFDNLPGDILTVVSATLVLDKQRTELPATGEPIYIDAYQVTDLVIWAEGVDNGASPPTNGGATWLWADYPTFWWDYPFNRSSTSLDQDLVDYGDNQLNLTSLVQGWADGSELNNGVVLLLSGGKGQAYNNRWHSKESTTGTGPQLVLDYIPGAAGPLAGDVDVNGFVGGADLTVVLTNWGQSGVGWAGGDIDPYSAGDGFVGGGDYTQVLSNWGAGTPPEAVPEPAMLGLILLGGLALLRHKR